VRVHYASLAHQAVYLVIVETKTYREDNPIGAGTDARETCGIISGGGTVFSGDVKSTAESMNLVRRFLG